LEEPKASHDLSEKQSGEPDIAAVKNEAASAENIPVEKAGEEELEAVDEPKVSQPEKINEEPDMAALENDAIPAESIPDEKVKEEEVEVLTEPKVSHYLLQEQSEESEMAAEKNEATPADIMPDEKAKEEEVQALEEPKALHDLSEKTNEEPEMTSDATPAEIIPDEKVKEEVVEALEEPKASHDLSEKQSEEPEIAAVKNEATPTETMPDEKVKEEDVEEPEKLEPISKKQNEEAGKPGIAAVKNEAIPVEILPDEKAKEEEVEALEDPKVSHDLAEKQNEESEIEAVENEATPAEIIADEKAKEEEVEALEEPKVSDDLSEKKNEEPEIIAVENQAAEIMLDEKENKDQALEESKDSHDLVVAVKNDVSPAEIIPDEKEKEEEVEALEEPKASQDLSEKQNEEPAPVENEPAPVVNVQDKRVEEEKVEVLEEAKVSPDLSEKQPELAAAAENEPAPVVNMVDEKAEVQVLEEAKVSSDSSEKKSEEPKPAPVEDEPAPAEIIPDKKAEEKVEALEEPKVSDDLSEKQNEEPEPAGKLPDADEAIVNEEIEEEEVEALEIPSGLRSLGGGILPDEANAGIKQRVDEKRIDFSLYAQKLPVGRREKETQQRYELFSNMDQSGNGQLSLAEIELGVLNYIGEDLFLMKPAMKMAYKAARGIGPDEDHDDKAFVEFKEFRIFLSMVRQYIELYAAFDAIDSGDDARISIVEFESSIEMLSTWGIQVKDPVATFSEIDVNGGGQVLFNEFCRWALKRHLDYDKSFDEGEIEAELQQVKINKENEYKAYVADVKEEDQRNEEAIDLAKYASMLPVGRTHKETQRRHKMFNDMDVSGNRQLSLAEIDTGIRGFLDKDLNMRSAIKMAYKAARAIDKDDNPNNMDDKYVEFSEFRILLVSVRQYMELQAAFNAIDAEGDHRINFEEFSTSLDMLKEWGVTVEDPKAAFDEIDSNDGGQILFAEFCAWAMKKGLDYDKDLESGDAKAAAKAVQIDKEEKPEIAKAPVKEYKKIGLDDLVKKLPIGRSDEEAAKRKEIFDSMDASGSGQLCLAEIDLGILNILGEEFFLMKPAIGMAYKASRGVDPRENMDASFVEFSEFRMLLCNITRYIELYAAFEAVDDGDDHRISLKEFESSVEMLKEWGVDVDDPIQSFSQIDRNGGGQVLFNEFAAWALKMGLDYDQDVDGGNIDEVDEEEVEAIDENEKTEHVVQLASEYVVQYKNNSNYSGIYDNSRGDKYNGYPIYRHVGQPNIVIFAYKVTQPPQWVIQPLEPSEDWKANAHGTGEDPASASWQDYVTISKYSKYTVSHTNDENYSGVYDNSTGEQYNGYPIYRKLGQPNFVMFAYQLGNPPMWVIQPLEPSNQWQANAAGSGEDPGSASWHDYVTIKSDIS